MSMNIGSPAEQYNDKSQLILLSKDKKKYKVLQSSAFMSNTIKAFANYTDDNEDWEAPSEPIPLPPIESYILELVITYCDYHTNNKTDAENIKNMWDSTFILDMDDDTLFNIIVAANFLDIKSLLDLCCKKVADYIKECKTPHEIRERFNIKNDFTPEEEAEIRKENEWCEE